MGHYQSRISSEPSIPGGVLYPQSSYLLDAFQEPEDKIRVKKMNDLLAGQKEKDFRVEFFCGSQVALMDEELLLQIAECYMQVFNESWNESWTVMSALSEVKAALQYDESRVPIVSLLFKEEAVIGFAWGYVMDMDNLNVATAPFSSFSLKRHECVDITRYWLSEVGGKTRFMTIRELGILKEYRQEKSPYIGLPMLQKAQDMGCKVVFFRTKTTSRAFKWSLGVGFIPLQFFMENGLLLMQGSIKYAVDILSGLVEGQKRKSQHMMMSNINRYFCL